MPETREQHLVQLVIETKGGDSLARELEKIARAQQESAKQARAMAVEYQRSNQTLGNVSRQVTSAASAMRSTNNIIKQSAFQFQDLAVQIAGGQDAIRAFGQQAPQLLSAFGTLGAVTGTIVGISIALPALKAAWSALIGSLEEGKGVADRFDKSLSELANTTTSIANIVKAFDAGKMIEDLAALDENARKVAISQIKMAQAFTESAKAVAASDLSAKLNDIATPKVLQSTGVVDFLGRSLNAITNGATNAEKAIEAQNQLGLSAKQYSNNLQILDDVKRGLAPTDKQIADLQGLAELVMRKNTKVALDYAAGLMALSKQLQQTKLDIEGSNKALKEGAETGFTVPEKGKKKKDKGEVVFNNEQLAKSEAIIRRLKEELNLTREQAAGVVGNLFHESAGLKTGARSKDGFGSVGLGQWTFERKTALKDFAAKAGTSITDFNTQVDFLIKELRTKENKALMRLKNTSGLEDATTVFRKKFERPDPDQAYDSRRIAAAKTAFLGGLTESEQANALKKEEDGLKAHQKAAEDAAKANERFNDTLAGMQLQIEQSRLPEIQRQIDQDYRQALQRAGIDINNMTEAQKRQAQALHDAAVEAAFYAEKQKLVANSAEDAKAKFEAHNEVLKEAAAISETVFNADTLAEELGKLKDALDSGIISVEEFKTASSTLGEEFNKSTAIAQQSADDMSQYWENAVRGMQGVMADFLFDPFKDGVNGMLDNLVTVLRKMAAEVVAAKLFESFNVGKDGGGSGGGFLDSLLSGAGSLFSSFSANGNVFQGGNVIPFASGGIVTAPVMFGMSGGRTGLMGEAGPEAIVPLHRGSDGKLGVKSDGGGKTINFNQTINVSGGDPAAVKRAAGQGAREILALVNNSGRYR